MNVTISENELRLILSAFNMLSKIEEFDAEVVSEAYDLLDELDLEIYSDKRAREILNTKTIWKQ